MNLDPLSFSLSEIEYDLNTLSKATYKNNSGEITQIVNYFGFEAERHVFKGVYVEIDLSDVRSGKDAPQLQIIKKEINTGHKPNFTTLLCYALENIIENQKNVKIPVIITNLLKVAKLSKLEEIVYALSLQYSSNNEVKDFTLNFLKQKLPEFFKLYIEGKITVITKDSDINCEIIYLFISALFNHENNLGISEDQYKKILRTLRRDFPFERAPLILAPFISSSSIHSTEGFTSQDGILVKKLVTELPSITKTMVDVSKLVVELGYDFCCSLETCQTNLIEIGVHEITPASVARILGAMANTHTGLNNGITLYFDKKESYPPTFVDEQQQFQSCTGPTSAITSGGSLDYVETSTTYLLNNLVGETINKNNSSPAVSSNSSSSAFTWNADIFVKAVKEVVPHFHWRDVVYELDQPGLVLKDKPGFKLITGAITQGLESNMETFPYDFFYRTWNNSEEQLSWLELIVKYPDVFRFADFPSRQVSTDILKLNPEEECDPRIAIWKSLDMIEALLKLSERGHYQRVQELFRFPLQYCPDVLILALLQIKGLLTLLGQDLIATLIPHFLTNNSNSLIVLQIAWHNQFHSHIARTLIMHSMADWYVKDPNDQTRLSRILDIAQDLKALSLLLNCSPYGFIIDLACLASRREYLKLEKWLTEKIREHSEPFIWALVYFLKRRCPGAFSHMANSNSAIVNLLCSDIKEANLPKVLQLPSDIVNGIMTTLQNFLSNYIANQQQQQQQQLQQQNPSPGQPILGGGSKGTTGLFFSSSSTSAPSSNSTNNYKSTHSSGGAQQAVIGQELMEVLTNLLGMKGMNLNTTSIVGGHLAGNSPRQSTPFEQQSSNGGNHVIPGGVPQPFQPFQQAAAAAAAAALTNLNNGRHKFNSNPNNLMAPPPPPPPPALQTGDRVLINQSSPPDGKNADDSGAMIDGSIMMIDGLLGKAVLSSGPSSTNDDDILDVTTFTRRLRAVLNNNYSSASASQQQQDTSATTAVNENGGGTLALDLSAMFPDMNMSSFGKDIEDETNAYFQRIYNRPPHPIMCLDDFLRMLKTFRDSPERREREVFACMIRNLFEEYRFFSTYPEKELHITSCLFGGLIEKGICNYVGLGIALRFVLEALKKPNKSDKMRYFGLTALDTFKERLKEYPQYCYHIAQIPHFTEEFPPYLIEYVEFGMKGQDVVGQVVKIPAPNPSKSFTPPPANAPPVQAQASITTASTATTTTTPSNQQPTIMSITNPTQQPTTTTNSSSNLQNTNNLLAMNPDSLLNPDNEIEEEENKGNFLVPPEPIQDKIAFIFNNLSLANINQKTEEIMDLLADENFPWVARYIAMKRASIENNFHTLYANFLDCIGKPQLNLLIIKDTFRNIKILLKSDKSAGNFSDRSLLKNLGHWLGLLTIAKNKPLLQSEIDLKQLVLDAALKGLQELLYVIPFAAKILESCSKSKVFKPPNPWTMGIMHLLAEIHKEPDMKLNLKFEIEMLCKTLNLDINTLVKNSSNELGRYKDRLIVLASMNEQQAAAAAQSQEQHTQSSNLGNLSSNLLPQQFAQQFQQFQQQLQNYQSSSQPSSLPPSKFGKFGGPQQLAAFNNRGGAAGVLGNLPPALSGLPPHLLSPAGFFSMMLMQQQQQQAQGLKDSSQQQLISDLLASLTSGGGTSGGGGGMLTSSTTPPSSSVSELHQPPPPSTTTTLIMTSSGGTTSNQNTNTASTNKQQQFLATLLANLSNSANAGAVPPIKMPPTFGGGAGSNSSIMPGSGSGTQQQNAAMIQHQLQQMIAAYASGQGPQQHTPASAASQPAHLQQPSKFGGPPMLGSTVSTVAQGGRLSQPPGIGGPTSQDGAAQYQQRSTSTTGTVSPKFRYIDIDITNGAAFLAQKLVINASLFKNEIQALLPALRQFARLALEKSLTEILPPLTERVLKITVSTAECLIKKDFAFDPDENRVRAASHHLIRFLAGGISLYTVREPLYASLLANFKNALAIGLKGMSIAPLVPDQQLNSDETQDSSPHSALTGAAGSAQGTSTGLGGRQNAGTSSATNNEFIEHAASVLAADNFELACCFAQKSVIERAVNELDRRWALIYLAASNKPRPFGSRTTLSASLPPSETATIDRLPPKIKPKMGGPNPNQAVVYEIFSKTIPGFQSHHQSKSNFAANLFPFQVGGSGSNTTPALGGVGSTPGGSTFAHNFSDTTGGLGTGMNEFSTSKYTTSPPQHTTVGRNTSVSVGLASGSDGPPFLHSRILAKLGVELDKCLLSMGVASENTVVNINTSALDTYVKPLVPISVLIRNVAGILAPVKDVSSANLNVIPLNLTSILGVNQPSSLMIGGSDETVHSSAVVISNTVLSGLQSLISKCLEGLQACFKTLDSFSGVGAEGGEVTSKMVNLPSINTSCTEEIEELINPSLSSNNQPPDDNTTTPSNTKNPLANSPPAKIKDAYLLILKTLQDSRVFGPQLVNKQITKCLMENKDDIGIDLEVFYVLYGNKLINTQLYDTYLSQCVLDNTSINNGALSMTDAFITKLIRRACCEDDGRDAFPLADSDFYKTIDTLFHYISRPGRRFNLELNQTLIKIRDNSDIVFLHTYNINLASPQTHTAAGGTGVENGNNSTTSGTQHQQHLNVEMSANNIYTGIFHSGISASKDFDDPPGLKEKVTYLYREWLETFYGFSRGDSSSMGTSNMSPPTNTGLLNFNSNMTPPLLATGAGGMGSSNFDKTSSSLTGGGLGATNITPFNNNPSTRQQQYAASSTPAVSINPESAITNFMMQMHQQGIFKTDDLITRFFRICTEICLEACYKALAERFALPVIPPNDYPSKTIIGPPTGGKSSSGTRNLLATSSPPPPSSVPNNSLLMFNVSFEERYKREILAQVKCYQHVDAYVKLIALLVKHSNQSLNNGTQVNLTNKVLGIFAGILIQHHRYPSFTIPGGTFQSLPFFRLFSVLYAEIVAMQALMDTHGGNIITAFCNAYHVIRPSEAPGFAYSWLELIAHRTFIGKTLTYPSQSKIWNYYALLLTDIFKFLAPYLRNVDLTDSLIYFYNGCLRLLLVLLHDFPEFLCDFHYGFCDIIPPNCIQMRNLILSAFPRDMRLPDPFTPNLKVDMLPEIGTSPKLTPYTDFGRMLCEHSMMSYSNSDEDLNTYASGGTGSDSHLNPVPNFGIMDATTSGFSESATSSTTNFASNETVLQFKKCLDVYLKTRSPVTFLTDIRPNLQRDPSPGSHYNIPLLNALVMYVGTQAIASIQNKGLTPGLSTITHSAHMDIFQNLAVGLDTEGRYLFLNAIANQLRYPNSHTHYFSCILLHLFAEANIEAIQEQITRVLLERLIVNRPHPWGLLITFIELIKNPSFHFWEHEFVRCAPEIEKLFDSVSKSCMQTTKPPVLGTSGPSMVPPPPPHGSVSTTLQPPTGFTNVNNARSQPVIPPSYH